MPQVVKYRTAHILINTQTNYLNISLQARAVPLGGGHSSTVENWSPGEVAKTPTQNYIYIYFFSVVNPQSQTPPTPPTAVKISQWLQCPSKLRAQQHTNRKHQNAF